jgi:transcriptional regulator with XRE-family HTH domain
MSIAETQTDGIPTWTLGDRFRKSREHAGFSREEMAERLGVPKGTLWKWETDATRPRDVVQMAQQWSEITRVPTPWLLGLVGSMTCFIQPERRLRTIKYDGPERRLSSVPPLQLVTTAAET